MGHDDSEHRGRPRNAGLYGESSVAAAASALHLAGEAASILIPRVAPALAVPVLILEKATKHLQKERQKALDEANLSLSGTEQFIKDKLVSSIYQAEQNFYSSDSYGKMRKELKAHLSSRGVDINSNAAFRYMDYALDNATANGQKIIPSNKSKLRADVQNRYSEIFETIRELHRAVSANVGPHGVFALNPYIGNNSELSSAAKAALGSPVELCRNPRANRQKAPSTIRKGVCGDKGSDAVFEAYYIRGADELQALVSEAWPMALKLKTSAAKKGPAVVPNKRVMSSWHVELVAAERGNLHTLSDEAAINRAKQNTDRVIHALKDELDSRLA